MPLIPPWAPSVHPMLVHFPIVLVLLALAADVAQLLRPGLLGPSRTNTLLYVLAALAGIVAYVTGLLGAGVVYVPGMAHVLVESHERWALFTTGAIVAVAGVRVVFSLVRGAETLANRVLFVAMGLVLAGLVQQTAERGARLVYEQGVGVMAGPRSD